MSNQESESNKQEVLVREAKVLVWGPIFITLSLEKINYNSESKSSQNTNNSTETSTSKNTDEDIESLGILEQKNDKNEKNKVNILKPISETKNIITNQKKDNNNEDNVKKVTYIYNLVDHGLDCECIDIKGELLIRSALPVYRKITQGIEFEQITTNQIKLIITSRVLDSYQEVFQGFTTPKATFRIWVLGYKF